VRARLLTPRKAAAPRGAPAHAAAAQPGPALETAAPPLSWQAPREAWRIIFVGTVPEARGRGVGAALYRAVMADRPLVARIARDNTASLRLHAAVGWRLFGDGDVVLAVHAADHSAATGAGRR
jgi:GNAT superfamily N-acetyltransferase